MRGFAGIAVGAVLSLSLGACYSSDAPLLTDANAVAPYAKITFRDKGSAGAAGTMTRDGKVYRLTNRDGTQLTLRFMPTDRADWYVAQVQGPPGVSGSELLYAVVKVDVAKREAQSYRTLAPDRRVATPGHHICKDSICIDDIRAYVSQGFEYADKGGPADVIYEITLE